MRRGSVILCVLTAAACGRLGFGPGDAPDVSDAAPVVGAYATAVIADAPIAYFRFNEPSGLLASSVVGGVTGEYQGQFQYGVPGAVDGDPAIRFDGRTTRIELGDRFRFADLAPYTFEIWIRPTTVANTRFVLDRRTTAQPVEGYTMYVGDTYFIFARQTNGAEFAYVGSAEPTLNVWTHAVITFDGSVQKQYRDGELVQENLGAGGAIGQGPGNFVVGDNSPGQFYKFEGELDELAIYDSALGEVQIAAHVAAAN